MVTIKISSSSLRGISINLAKIEDKNECVEPGLKKKKLSFNSIDKEFTFYHIACGVCISPIDCIDLPLLPWPILSLLLPCGAFRSVVEHGYSDSALVDELAAVVGA